MISDLCPTEAEWTALGTVDPQRDVKKSLSRNSTKTNFMRITLLKEWRVMIDPFDWVEDVEEEIPKREAAMTDLWHREHFDWAEDVEENILKTEAGTNELFPSERFDWAEDVEEEILKNETSKSSSPSGELSDENLISNETSETSSGSIVPIFCQRPTQSWEYIQEEVNNEFARLSPIPLVLAFQLLSDEST
ncbi:hypothetical protein N7486_009948 [Penicillium sp. IBT 16267x]|nr:hypothetical protein N7486_009948 [Penicillium sp. IBT 16267x]